MAKCRLMLNFAWYGNAIEFHYPVRLAGIESERLILSNPGYRLMMVWQVEMQQDTTMRKLCEERRCHVMLLRGTWNAKKELNLVCLGRLTRRHAKSNRSSGRSGAIIDDERIVKRRTSRSATDTLDAI